MLGGYSASVMAGGHTHSQMLRRYEDMPIVNVGSIGLAGVNQGSPGLAANRDLVEPAKWSAEYRAVPPAAEDGGGKGNCNTLRYAARRVVDAAVGAELIVCPVNRKSVQILTAPALVGRADL
jgi:hypothetical protein